MQELTPCEVVARLDQYIVGQNDAKRAVAIALRNRWRWKQLPEDMRREVTPKNILMIGPTGVGKTEITRRLANLTRAPFVKVEASKYTEVGYYGRDVESIIRDLVEASINIVNDDARKEVEEEALARVEDRLLDLLLKSSEPDVGEPRFLEFHNVASAPQELLADVDGSDSADETRPTEAHDVESIEAEAREQDRERRERQSRIREKFRQMLRDGKLEERIVELSVEQKAASVQMFSGLGVEQMDPGMQSVFERLIPSQTRKREATVEQARTILLEQLIEELVDRDSIQEDALRLAEASGIVFIDEMDKVCVDGEGSRGPDVSRQGVQRDLLPIVEGTTVQTRYGSLKTDNILFIAAGAFHKNRPSDMMPELQGRFPIRVELTDLTRDDFVRILTEPEASLTRQYAALLKVEGVMLSFTDDAIQKIADVAFQMNQSTQNIGARRLHTILERLLEEVSFNAPDLTGTSVVIDTVDVARQLGDIIASEDLSQFIL
ncbi:MAG: ATP-dependent protease ATPase subunit HslU [Planctomycetota bacterium]|nr:ATP-dependent protease ATPase subunit HslU [Planctomycetota bacterium]MDA1162308.1 ATP-dependent protease ATPase subunit HslU [Planctomycetota bacterium]